MEISTPTLIIDEQKCRANIKTMADKARADKKIFRPHFKTHQSRVIAGWFREEGVTAITVSSFGMAEYFANAGWQEITVAFPVNVLQVDLINKLAGKIRLNLLVDNLAVISLLEPKLLHNVEVYIEIDCGSNRTGVSFDDHAQILALTDAIGGKLQLKGFYTHAGHTYKSRSAVEVIGLFETVIQRFTAIRDFVSESAGRLEFCMGDTPSCSVASHFPGIDAISPGNFVFYDVMQTEIGACQTDAIAVALACPVVSKNVRTKEICVYGGAVHLSKESVESKGENMFGKVVKMTDQAWSAPLPSCFVRSLSQEHGILKLSENEFDRVLCGDVIGVLPVHSCLTAEAMGFYRSLAGEPIDHYAKKNRDSSRFES